MQSKPDASLPSSQEIYKFVLLQEEGIAKGIRRIVAVTGWNANTRLVLLLTFIACLLAGPQAAVEATLKAKSLSRPPALLSCFQVA